MGTLPYFGQVSAPAKVDPTTCLQPNALVGDYAYSEATIFRTNFIQNLLATHNYGLTPPMRLSLISTTPRPHANFWQTLRKVAAGLVAFVPAARVLATDIDQVVEKFVKGRVLEATPQLMVVETPERGDIVALLSRTTIIWDDGLAKDIPIESDDVVTAWVSPRGRGVCEVKRLWVNWVSLQSRVMNLRGDQTGATFEHHTPDRAPLVVVIDPRTLLVTHELSAAFAHSTGLLTEGAVVQLIGRRLREGSVLATTVSLPER